MDTRFMELLSLARNGSVWLAQRDVAAPQGPEILPWVDRVHFAFQPGRGAPIAASDTPAWLTQLAERGATSLLVVSSGGADQAMERVEVAWGGEQGWALVATTSSGAELWRGVWSPPDSESPGSRWLVRFFGVPRTALEIERLALTAAEARLSVALDDVRAFAADHGDDKWVRYFDRARAILEGDTTPQASWAAQNGRYSPAAGRLFAAASQSWVWGGMGSWNDDGPRDERFEPLSDQLYLAIMTALIVAVNTPPAPVLTRRRSGVGRLQRSGRTRLS